MGDEQDRDLSFLDDPGDELQHCLGRVRIDARGGFVEHQDVGPGCQGAGDEHALFLAAGEFGEPLAGKLLGTHHPQAFPGKGALAWGTKRPGRTRP